MAPPQQGPAPIAPTMAENVMKTMIPGVPAPPADPNKPTGVVVIGEPKTAVPQPLTTGGANP